MILGTLPYRIHPMVVDIDLLLLKTKANASLGHLHMPNIMMGSQSIEGMAMDSTLPLDMGYSTTSTLDHTTMSNKCRLMKHHLGLIQCHCLDLLGVKSLAHSDIEDHASDVDMMVRVLHMTLIHIVRFSRTRTLSLCHRSYLIMSLFNLIFHSNRFHHVYMRLLSLIHI